MKQENFSIKKMFRRQRGYSLVELSIVLAIVAVISVGAIIGTRSIIQANAVNTQIKDSAAVMAKIQRLFINQADTSGISMANLVRMGVWPAERSTAASTKVVEGKEVAVPASVRGVLSGSGEAVTTNTASIGSLLKTKTGFFYRLSNVPTTACADLVSGFDGMAYAIYVQTAGATAEPAATDVVKVADTNTYDAGNLATACDVSKANAVDVVLAIRLQ